MVVMIIVIIFIIIERFVILFIIKSWFLLLFEIAPQKTYKKNIVISITR